jgi:hypothetical protein
MHVTDVMSTTGIITGKVSPDKQAACRSVVGVANIEPDQEMRAI